jgi:hypothetical protein
VRGEKSGAVSPSRPGEEGELAGGERRARHHGGVDALEQVLAQHRGEVERHARHHHVALLAAQLDPAHRGLLLLARLERAPQPVARALQPLGHRAHLGEQRRQRLEPALVGLERSRTRRSPSCSSSTSASSPSSAPARPPCHTGSPANASVRPHHRLPLPLEPRLQQVEHEVGVVARGVRRRHEPRLDEVERRGAQQVGALGELRGERA